MNEDKLTESGLSPREEKALSLFLSGYNCAQAVFAAFADLTGLGEKDALRIASSFGGGIARQRETCGSVSAAALTLGYLFGYDEPDRELCRAHYARVSAFCNRFREANGSLSCAELLSLAAKKAASDRADPTPTPRSPDFYGKRPCARLVVSSVEILETILREEEKKTAK
ncbi:MAG: C_GCAxxG_C_C family protein [Clostridia bacterium]|nr:C_GCAxxG_C_C family protein [Clostridia bacterium]